MDGSAEVEMMGWKAGKEEWRDCEEQMSFSTCLRDPNGRQLVSRLRTLMEA